MLLSRKKFNIIRFLLKSKKFLPTETEKFEIVYKNYLKNGSMVQCKKFGLKLILISDTHGDLAFGDRFGLFMKNIHDYDLLIILGDINKYELVKILQIVPVEKIIALRGNHDSFDVYDEYGIQNINGKIFIYNGIKFAGIEGSFKYKQGSFPSYTQHESLFLANKMEPNADILLSHDCIFTESKYDAAHSGLIGITYYVFENGVKWHIHGHIHKSYVDVYSNGTNEKSVYGCEYIEI